MKSSYTFEENPEYHVWDDGNYEQIDSASYFKQGWMGRFLESGDRVLDIGCGPGYNVKVLRDNGVETLGVDLNAALVRRAKEAGLNVVEQDAVCAIKEHGRNFDVFVMSDFIEHIPLAVAHEIFREIAGLPNKRVFFSTPNLDSLMGFKFWFHMPTHVNAMHPCVIRKMLQSLGYTLEEEWTEYGNLPGTGWKLGLRKWLLEKLVGPTQARLFYGGANVCYFVRSCSGR
jgi:SAM-dependent methyltransferase